MHQPREDFVSSILIVRGGGWPLGRFAMVNYPGCRDHGAYLAGGCGDTNGRPCIAEADHLGRARAFGRTVLMNGASTAL